MCNFNRELNQMDSCIAQSSLFNTLETLTLAETYAGKSSFAGDIYGIAAFLAVANNCVFSRNLYQTCNWRQRFMYFWI